MSGACCECNLTCVGKNAVQVLWLHICVSFESFHFLCLSFRAIYISRSWCGGDAGIYWNTGTKHFKSLICTKTPEWSKICQTQYNVRCHIVIRPKYNRLEWFVSNVDAASADKRDQRTLSLILLHFVCCVLCAVCVRKCYLQCIPYAMPALIQACRTPFMCAFFLSVRPFLCV